MNGSKKRLFIAIALPGEVLELLKRLQNELKRFARDAKWVRQEGIHLTLKFLGYVEPERIPDILTALTPIANDSSGFPVQIKGCGFFPNSRRPNVLWCGVESPRLGPLQQDVENAMSQIGFDKENRAFTPHLTLARFRDPHGLMPLAQEVEKKKEILLSEFIAQNFKLYESILHREGAEYRIVESFPFR